MKTKKLATVVAIVFLLLLAVLLFSRGMGGSADEQFMKMDPGESDYCRQILWQIKPGWSHSQVQQLLGAPTRDMGMKQNWWVTIGNRKDRVGVYFDGSGGATDIVLDGGPGRFYYRRPVSDHLAPPRQPESGAKSQ